MSNWVGDRARDLDYWWNGRDVEVNDNGRWRQGHEAGVGERIGQWLGNAANDVSRFVGNAPNEIGRFANNVADDVLGRYQVIDTDENGNLVYGNQRQGGALNRIGRSVNDNFITPVSNAANDVVNGVGRFAQNAADDVLGRYQVIDTDENGNLVYGNQRQGGALNRFGRAVNDNVITPVSNAANDFVRGTDYWWNGTPYNELYPNAGPAPGPDPNPRVGGIRRGIDSSISALGNAANDAFSGVGRAVNNAADDVLGRYQVIDTDENGNLVYGNQRQGGALNRLSRDVGRWAGDNVVTPVSNAMNGIGQFVRDTADNAGQAVGNFANYLGDNTGAIGLNAKAVAAGVPLGTVGHWDWQLANGEISQSDYEDLLNRYISNSGR